MRVIFHPEAHAEMIEHAPYYELKSKGLGLDFLTAVEEATKRIERFPKAGAIDRARSASASFLDFRSRFSTKYSRIESTSRL